ncbi:hypothetical protein MY3296_005493 [Beauveria thailandica]
MVEEASRRCEAQLGSANGQSDDIFLGAEMALFLLTGRISTEGLHSSGYILLSPLHKQRKPHPISPSAISGGLRWA